VGQEKQGAKQEDSYLKVEIKGMLEVTGNIATRPITNYYQQTGVTVTALFTRACNRRRW
jgi:hypothetical protein